MVQHGLLRLAHSATISSRDGMRNLQTTVALVAIALVITMPVKFIGSAAFDAPHKCKHDVDCPKSTNQFCRGDICHDCVKCVDFFRNTGLGSSCLRDETECGSCFDGYREVINGHPPYGKQCEVHRSSAPHLDTVGGAQRFRGSGTLSYEHGSAAPSRSAEIGITVGVTVVTAAIVVGIMAAVYYYLRHRRLQSEANEKPGHPRIIEMQEFPILAKSQLVTRRQETEDQFKAVPLETSPMTGDMAILEEEEQEEAINAGSEPHPQASTGNSSAFTAEKRETRHNDGTV